MPSLPSFLLLPRRYGRNFYCRYDYEGVDAAAADEFFARLRLHIADFAAAKAADAAYSASASSRGHDRTVPPSQDWYLPSLPPRCPPAEALSGGYALAAADEFRCAGCLHAVLQVSLPPPPAAFLLIVRRLQLRRPRGRVRVGPPGPPLHPRGRLARRVPPLGDRAWGGGEVEEWGSIVSPSLSRPTGLRGCDGARLHRGLRAGRRQAAPGV